MVKDRSFYLHFCRLAIVITLNNLITFAVNLADNIMLGAYSETALSGAAAVNQISYFLVMFNVGIVGGVIVIASQYWGRKELEPIRRIIGLGVRLAALLGLIALALCLLLPEGMVRIFAGDKEIVSQGVAYLRILCFSFPIMAVSNAMIMSMRSVETTAIGPMSSLTSLVFNIGLNYILIFGKLGLPAMGIRGAALATLIARVVELIVVVLYLKCIDQKLHLKLLRLFRPDHEYLRDFFRVGVPTVLTNTMTGLSSCVQTAILGHMTGPVLAANSMATTIYQVFVSLSIGTAHASMMVMGRTVGEGQGERIRPYARTLQVLYVAMGLVMGALLLLLRPAALRLYGVSTETKALASRFLLVLAVCLACGSYSMPTASGIIQGGGNTRYPFLVDALFMWCLCIPLAALSAYVWQLSPIFVFFFLKMDQILKCIPNAIYCNSFRWVRKLTR